jgi:hypothetical protein
MDSGDTQKYQKYHFKTGIEPMQSGTLPGIKSPG